MECLATFILESAQVESLSGGKSMESIKSAAISDLEGPAIGDEETTYQISLQVCIPFLIAGIGTIGAGIVLGNVEVLTTPNLITIEANNKNYRTPKFLKTSGLYIYWYLLFWA